MSYVLKILIPFILFSNTLSAQKKKPKEQRIVQPFYIEVKVSKKDLIAATNYNKVVLYDCRIDSFSMGSVWLEIQSPPQELRFMGGTLNYLQGKFNALAGEGLGQETLYVILKDLDYKEGITQAGWFGSAISGSSEKITSNLHYNADLYLSAKNGVQKIGNIDTVFTAMRWMPDNAAKLTERMLKYTLTSAQAIDSAVFENLTTAQFETITSGPALPPVLLTKEHPKGIFFSFEQFLNNAPINTPFEYKPAKFGVTMRYKDPADTTEDIAWGFSDAINMYIHIDSFYYRLDPSGKHFYVTAPETVEIINRLGSKAVSKAMNVASLYFIYTNPFKIFSLFGLTKKMHKWVPELKTYELDIYNGGLR
ncbi:MAG: hypothetical protein NTW29_07840 [Bacteroidetes bacterium]|nr:hypothetical protein [Bacteroidota bacterium]